MYFGNGICQDARRLRLAGRAARSSRTARLARDRVRPHRLGRQSDAAADRDVGHLQAVLASRRPNCNERDPENRLLARGPRFRLPAEMIRDTALSCQRTPESDHRWAERLPVLAEEPVGRHRLRRHASPRRSIPISSRRGCYRRSMYTFWKRTAPPATLNIFDAPDREKCTARRTLTNTPLQALALMNDPTYRRSRPHARAARCCRKPERDAARIQYGFRLATGRAPSTKEAATLRHLLANERDTYATKPTARRNCSPSGARNPDTHLKRPELAAWTVVASAILNLDETITKE